jgi:hypothetical protein
MASNGSSPSTGYTVRQAVEGALAALQLADRYSVERVVFSEEGQWCVRLRALAAPDPDLSVCVEWADEDFGVNRGRFMEKIARYLAFATPSHPTGPRLEP